MLLIESIYLFASISDPDGHLLFETYVFSFAFWVKSLRVTP